MSPYYTILLLAFLILLAVLLIRYVNNAVDGEFRNLARASTDADYRRDELRRTDAMLGGRLPVAGDVRPLPGRGPGFLGGAAPVLTALGVILLWGAGSLSRERELWLYGGLASLALAGLAMLMTLRRRTWARTARLLLYRADLRRMDGDRAGAAEDLRQLLRVTPWDDSAWAELSDDLSAQGKLPEALAAMEAAAEIDPKYDEYSMVRASLAIRIGDLARAEKAILDWRTQDGVPDDDPRLRIYHAALQLAKGDRDAAAGTLRETLFTRDKRDLDFLDEDQALAGIRDLLPGRTT